MANTPAACEAAREAFRKHFTDKSKQPFAEAEELLSDVMEVWKVTQAIRGSNTNTDCEAALEAMRKHFKAKKVHNNGEALVFETEKFYRQNYDVMGGYDSRRNRLIRIEVIGYQQRLCPAFTLQCYAFGVYDLVYEGKKLSRSFEFRNDRGVLILPLDSNPNSRLGFDYFCGVPGFWRRARGGWPCKRAAVAVCCLLANLCRAKTSVLPVLCNVQISKRILNLSTR
jgi:hypothetical protein